MPDGYWRFGAYRTYTSSGIEGGQKSVEDLAKSLEFDPDKLTLDIIRNYDFHILDGYPSHAGNATFIDCEDRGTTFPDDLFPNIDEVFANEIDKTSRLSFKTVTHTSSFSSAEKREIHKRNNVERAKQQRVADYFDTSFIIGIFLLIT